MNPRIVKNLFDPAVRIIDATGKTGTGSVVQSTENNGLVHIAALSSGSSGQAYETKTYTAVANQWYCLSFEVVAFSGLTTGANTGLLWTAGGFDNGNAIITEDDIIAGGIGRYANIMMDTVGGAKAFRLGCGVSSAVTDKNLTIKNIMIEEINLSGGAFPSEYVYPGYKAAYDVVNRAGIIIGNKVVEESGAVFAYDKTQNLLVLGDSKSDEVDDIGGAIDNALGKYGICQIHAEPNWTTAELIGPTSLHTDFETTSLQAIEGTLRARTLSGAGVYEMSDAQGLRADIVIISNMGVNDIAAGAAEALTVPLALTNIETIIGQILAAGKIPCVTEITPWNGNAGFSETDGDQVQTYVYNRGLKDTANAKGAIFVPLYKAFGDSTDPDKLSDGAGTSPNYSDDGLHINSAGCQVAAGLIRGAIQLWAQGG